MFEIILAVPVSVAFLFAPEFDCIPSVFTADWWLAALALLTLKLAISLSAQRTLSEESTARRLAELQGTALTPTVPSLADPALLQTTTYVTTIAVAGFLAPWMPFALAGALSSLRWLQRASPMAKPAIPTAS